MRYKAVLFDLDGTLLDTIADIGNTMNMVLRSRGWPEHGIDAYKEFIGEGLEVLVRTSLPPGKQRDDIAGECLLDYRRHYAEHWSDYTTIYGGVPVLLNELTRRRVRINILSNKSDPFTREMAAYYLSRWHFDVIRGSLPDVPNKPDPASALAIARSLNIRPEKCIFLGDSGVDMKTAVAAGMFPVGATWGYRSAEELKQSGAAALVSHPLELLDIS